MEDSKFNLKKLLFGKINKKFRFIAVSFMILILIIGLVLVYKYSSSSIKDN